MTASPLVTYMTSEIIRHLPRKRKIYIVHSLVGWPHYFKIIGCYDNWAQAEEIYANKMFDIIGSEDYFDRDYFDRYYFDDIPKTMIKDLKLALNSDNKSKINFLKKYSTFLSNINAKHYAIITQEVELTTF